MRMSFSEKITTFAFDRKIKRRIMGKNNKGKNPAEHGKKLSTGNNTMKQTTKAAAPKVSSQKSPRTITRTTAMVMAFIVTASIIALGVFHLIVRNADVLFMAQSKDYFTTNKQFLHECMLIPGGLISYVSSYLTQFFYHPTLGASIMMGIWVICLWLSKLAFRVKTEWLAVLAIPIVCLLVGMIDTGYWLYYVKQTGYWFYGTIGYLAAMVLVALFSFVKKPTDKVIITVLMAFSYPYLGWYSLLAIIYATVLYLSEKHSDIPIGKRLLQPIAAVLLVVFFPWFLYRFYPDIRIEDAWVVGFPFFMNDNLDSITPEIPYIIMVATPLLFPFLPRQKESTGGMAWLAYVTTVVVIFVACVWTEKSDFQNYNYHAEMRMYRAAEEQDWDKVLDEMGSIPSDASRQMVLLKNIALLNKGEMGTKMFKYNNMGEPPTNGFDTLNVHMVQTAAPLIYYYHGKTNFSSRWCIENSVEFGFDYDNLKMLARCALVGGEMDVARKYLDILKTTIYYKDWAENLMPILDNPKLIDEHHEFDSVRELRDHMGTVLDGDNGLCEMYLLNYFSNTMNKDSKLLQELTLNYALIQKDIQLFWPRFFLYAELHKGDEMPTHYQEAAYLYGNLEPQNVNISNMPFDKTVKERYQGFQQLSQSLLKTGMKAPEVGEAMKGSYGDTFYWFYFFCRDIHSY